jgi:hypothetical protein
MSTTTLNRCVGSARFDIEAHEAPISEFPAQPSQPDGRGRMCQVHWKQYTAGLRKDALEREAAERPPAPETPARGAAGKAEKASPRAKADRQSKRSPTAQEVEQAEALIADVDALPAEVMVRRVGDDDVQEAIEMSATARVPEPAA